MAKRFFIQSSMIDGQTARISGAEFSHMVSVMRLKPGDSVVLCTGDGLDLFADIAEVGKKELTAVITDKVQNDKQPDVQITLFQAVTKGEKLELITQKITELGAYALTPFTSEFTVAQGVNAAKSERLQRIALEAAKQCGRAVLPLVNPVIGFSEVCAAVPDFDTVIFPCEHETVTPISAVLSHLTAMRPRKIAVVIGSEGGFSTKEYEELKSAGAIACSLGRRILRAETAAVTACALVMCAAGGMEP